MGKKETNLHNPKELNSMLLKSWEKNQIFKYSGTPVGWRGPSESQRETSFHKIDGDTEEACLQGPDRWDGFI